MTRNRNITRVLYAARRSVKTTIPICFATKYKISAGDELEWDDEEGYIRFKKLEEINNE